MLKIILYPRRTRKITTIAFYNVENLFHPEDDKRTNDRDFTPNGIHKWTIKRYRKK